MDFSARKTELSEILLLRRLFLEEANTQIRYNAVHERGWSDSYLLSVNGLQVGYASVNGQGIKDRDTVFEFYIIPTYRKFSSSLFKVLLAECKATFIECQSNNLLLSSIIFEFTASVRSEVILFSDHSATNLTCPGAIFRKRNETDKLFEHKYEPEGSHVIELNGEVLATGGFLLHYNIPFCDLYMEVREDARKKGLGSYLIQEIKKESYFAGRIPAARTGIENHASKATLLKAGMQISGFMLLGEVNKQKLQ